jgi:PAS domain S-box-containing protein
MGDQGLRPVRLAAVLAVLCGALALASRYNYLLFHGLVESFSVVVSAGIFMVAWNARTILDNRYFLVIGIVSLFVAGIDLLHFLSFKGMGVFPGQDANLPTQLWIAARSLHVASFLAAPLFVSRRVRPASVFAAAGAGALGLLAAIFVWHVFPDCYVEGTGLTPFKKGAEYVICAGLVGALLLLRQRRRGFNPKVYRLLCASILLTIAAELAFTSYLSVYSLPNMLGHILKVAAFFLAYKAVIETAFIDPYNFIFMRLTQNEEELLLANEELELRVAQRTAELDRSNEALRLEIGERRQAEEALREREARFSSLITNIPGAVYHGRFDPQRSMEFVSHGITEITGYPPEEFIASRARTFASLIHDEDRELALLTIGAAVAGRHAYALEYRIHAVDGALRWVNEKGQVIFSPGSDEVWLDGILFDITERRQMEEERNNLQQQLLQAQKLESLGRLAGGVAHDFNNILTGIIGFSELLLERLPKQEQDHEFAQLINDGGRRAADLAGQLLAFSRKQVLEMKPVSINRVVEQVTRMLSRVIGEDIVLDIRCQPDIGTVLADAGQLEQVLLNLAINARDAMPRGGRLFIETEETVMDEECAAARPEVHPGRYSLFIVTDEGEGMSREVQERIFEPFFTTKEQGKGTGLGLATAYGIIRQHNGHIWVYSEPGVGTSFKVYLPVIREEAVAEPAQAAAVKRRGTETVLVVDDEPYIRRLVMETLAPLGYTVLEAGSGNEALHLVEGLTARIDLLLVDVIMPGMNGRQLADLLAVRRPGMRTIFMSGYTDSYITGQGLTERGEAFLQKPLSPVRIAESVRTLLDG